MIRDGSSKVVQSGRPVGLGCPECSGGMSEVTTGQALHYVCHVGHSYSPETFLAARDENIEAAAWTVVSAMQEKATVKEELAGRAARSGDEEGRRRHMADALRISRAAFLIRDQLLTEERETEV
jgi:two-component system chemotaxis response regulator CheB